jgi:predicted DCC family thiol-disulfide oxidoreductase YuxK
MPSVQPKPAPPDLLTLSHQHPIVLFDGVCNFCDATINFLIQRDIQARLRFAPLQEPAGQALLRSLGKDTETFDTFLLLDGGQVYQRSTAGLRVLRYLPGAWSWLSGLIVIPAFLRDAVYQIIARNRYRWFGRTDACMIPDASVRGRFLA